MKSRAVGFRGWVLVALTVAPACFALDSKAVATKLQACPAMGNARGDCLQRVRNELLGLPLDYVPARENSTAIQDVTPSK